MAREEAAPKWMSEAGGSGEGLLKVIQAGQGASGFWPQEVLERDGPIAWPAGTHMYIDHPEVETGRARSMQTLVGITTEAAAWQENGPGGPGLYARAQIVEDMKDWINARVPFTGVSIRADAVMAEGGRTIEQILASPLNSIDFVSRAGAGGRVVTAFESASESNQDKQESGPMAQENQGAAEAERLLNEVRAERAAIAKDRSAMLREHAEVLAHRMAAESDAKIPPGVLNDCVDVVCANPPLGEDGSVDREALRTRLNERIDKTKKLIESAGGKPEAKTEGAGSGDEQEGNGVPTLEESHKALVAEHISSGVPKPQAERMAFQVTGFVAEGSVN